MCPAKHHQNTFQNSFFKFSVVWENLLGLERLSPNNWLKGCFEAWFWGPQGHLYQLGCHWVLLFPALAHLAVIPFHCSSPVSCIVKVVARWLQSAFFWFLSLPLLNHHGTGGNHFQSSQPGKEQAILSAICVLYHMVSATLHKFGFKWVFSECVHPHFSTVKLELSQWLIFIEINHWEPAWCRG